MVKQKKKSWWDRLEVPLASLALAATVFGALRKSGHLAQWQRNNTPWSAANAPAAGPPARKKQRLAPGPTGLQVAASALAPVVQAATAVPAAAAHAAVSATLGPVAADVAASEGRRIAAAVIASVLAPASSAAPAVSVPAIIVASTKGGVVAVPKVQKPVRMEGITRPSQRVAALAAAFESQLPPIREKAVAMEGVTRSGAPVCTTDMFRPRAPAPPRQAPVRTADISADPPRSVRQRRGAMENVSDRCNRPARPAPHDLPRSARQRRGTMQNVGDRYNQPGRLAGQDGRRTVIPRLPGMNDVRDQ